MGVSYFTDTGARRFERILAHVFQAYPGSLALRLWDGRTLHMGEGPPAFTLVFHDRRAYRDLMLHRSPLQLAEAYFRNQVDVEGDLYAALQIKDYLQSLTLSPADKAALLLAALLASGAARAGNTPPDRQRAPGARWAAWHGKDRDRQAIAYHYDVSNAFYALWLDTQMVYSCAYFEHEAESLDQAQSNKLEYICRKLRLRRGERLLDIGCGWGALICWAARHHGVRAHGITLSRNQYEHCLHKIREEGLTDWVSVELQDYRDLAGEAVFDKIVSVGMFEHVGLKNLPLYFNTVQRLLKPNGLFLNHGITHSSEGWQKSVSTTFINRYVFPNGELDRMSNIQRVMEQSGFEILDVEGLRPHYAMTLRHWVQRLESRREEALRHVGEATYRVWRLYMTACALAFEEGGTGVYQIVAAKRASGQCPVPLTRRDLYR